MDPWLNEFDRLNQQTSEISADIKELQTQTRLGPNANTAKLSATIRRKLVQLTTDIAGLQDSLPRIQTTEKEKLRRRDMLLNLATRKDQLSDSMSRVSNPGLGDLAPQQEPAGGKKRTWGAQPQETEETRSLNNAQVVQLQKDRMAQQDEHLDVLSGSILRQGEIARTINTELDVHNKLLDDLEGHVDRTNVGIMKTTERVKKVHESAKVGGMWCAIIFLIIILIVLAATHWGCSIYSFKNC